MLIDILPVLLFAVFLWKLRPVKPAGEINEDYISIKTGNYLRGFFAIVVILHHLAQRTDSGILFRAFYDIGYPAVGLFFFLSGYGLQKSYMMKRDAYRKHFLMKRLPPILIPYIVVTIMFWVMDFVAGYTFGLKDILWMILHGEPLVLFSWYIISILIFYVVYWILMVICRDNDRLMLLGGCIWYLIYMKCCKRICFGRWWYNVSPLLIVGMAWALYEDKILEKIKGLYRFLLPLSWIGFFGSYQIVEILKDIQGKDNEFLIAQIMTAFFFVVGIMLISMKVHMGNKLLAFLGSISLEIYLVQGLLMEGLRNGTIYVHNEAIWSILVVVGSVIMAYILHTALKPVITRYNHWAKGV